MLSVGKVFLSLSVIFYICVDLESLYVLLSFSSSLSFCLVYFSLVLFCLVFR